MSFRAISLLILAVLFCTSAFANTITVDNASSGSVPGSCTIQDAVKAANTNAAVSGCAAGSAGADTIVFAPGITSITLASDMLASGYGLAVSEDLTIDGGAVPGSAVPKVTIARNSAPLTPAFGIIAASADIYGPGGIWTLTLRGLRISNGLASSGAGIYATRLNLHDSIVDTNSTSGPGAGAIYTKTTSLVDYSTISNNTAGAGPGALAGGITCDGDLSLDHVTISGNSTSGSGGGIYCNGGVTITTSTVSQNSAVYDGGGISAPWIVSIAVTMTQNHSAGNSGTVYLTPPNLVPPGAPSFGHTVIAGNTGGGVDLYATTTLTLHGDHSWIGSMNAVASSNLQLGVSIGSCGTLGLGALANNGGALQTNAVLANSCLRDTGDVCAAAIDPYDERGASYTRCVNTRLDIGAFEYQGAAAASYSVTYNGNGNTGGSVPVDASSPYLSGATVTVLGNTGSLTRAGFSFAGWNTAANGSGISYTGGNTFSMGSANVTLYAQWSAAPLTGPAQIPTLSQAGMLVLSLMLLVMAGWLVRRS